MPFGSVAEVPAKSQAIRSSCTSSRTFSSIGVAYPSIVIAPRAEPRGRAAIRSSVAARECSNTNAAIPSRSAMSNSSIIATSRR